jgi:hypothetical protein
MEHASYNITPGGQVIGQGGVHASAVPIFRAAAPADMDAPAAHVSGDWTPDDSAWTPNDAPDIHDEDYSDGDYAAGGETPDNIISGDISDDEDREQRPYRCSHQLLLSAAAISASFLSTLSTRCSTSLNTHHAVVTIASANSVKASPTTITAMMPAMIQKAATVWCATWCLLMVVCRW